MRLKKLKILSHSKYSLNSHSDNDSHLFLNSALKQSGTAVTYQDPWYKVLHPPE